MAREESIEDAYPPWRDILFDAVVLLVFFVLMSALYIGIRVVLV